MMGFSLLKSHFLRRHRLCIFTRFPSSSNVEDEEKPADFFLLTAASQAPQPQNLFPEAAEENAQIGTSSRRKIQHYSDELVRQTQEWIYYYMDVTPDFQVL